MWVGRVNVDRYGEYREVRWGRVGVGWGRVSVGWGRVSVWWSLSKTVSLKKFSHSETRLWSLSQSQHHITTTTGSKQSALVRLASNWLKSLLTSYWLRPEVKAFSETEHRGAFRHWVSLKLNNPLQHTHIYTHTHIHTHTHTYIHSDQ